MLLGKGVDRPDQRSDVVEILLTHDQPPIVSRRLAAALFRYPFRHRVAPGWRDDAGRPTRFVHADLRTAMASSAFPGSPGIAVGKGSYLRTLRTLAHKDTYCLYSNTRLHSMQQESQRASSIPSRYGGGIVRGVRRGEAERPGGSIRTSSIHVKAGWGNRAEKSGESGRRGGRKAREAGHTDILHPRGKPWMDREKRDDRRKMRNLTIESCHGSILSDVEG